MKVAIYHCSMEECSSEEYWLRISQLSLKYRSQLRVFLDSQEDFVTYERALAAYHLLTSTPQTHKFGYYPAILDALEKQLQLWLCE